MNDGSLAKDIIKELKGDFLIIGFTGPLRSGCTTAAKFYCDETHFKSTKGLTSGIAKIIHDKKATQRNIMKTYKEINDIKINIFSSKKDPEINILTKRRLNLEKKMINLLKKREIIRILQNHQENRFRYISMTDMIIKRLIELDNYATKYNESVANEKREAIALILRTIEKKTKGYNLEKMRELGNKIKDRDFTPFEDSSVHDEYEDYIFHKIPSVREKLTKRLNLHRDTIGDIFQDFGDNIRKCGNPLDYESGYGLNNDLSTVFILAEEANNIIKFLRSNKKRKQDNKQFAIEAFRNPCEVHFFRNRYNEFYLFSLYADDEIRKNREEHFSEKRNTRDKGEEASAKDIHKQNVTECVKLSDIALNNNGKIKELSEKLIKYFALIRHPGCFSPDWKESAMHLAYSMSARSTCICRQVGAVIEGAKGYIIGAGWNDVGRGQVGCGYRHYDDIESLTLYPHDNRKPDFKQYLQSQQKKNKINGDESFCYKDEYSQYKIEDDIGKMYSEHPNMSAKERDFLEASKKFDVKRMQYCRALHAEENAILQTAINGGIGIRGGKIYSTTFPCELCAKKIYQAGIRTVIYTEPYPRSISKDVFFEDGSRKIKFEQFEGVKSNSYFRLYKSIIDKKDSQKLNRTHI